MEHCKQDVPDGGRSVRFHQCTRKSVKDGYCKQHHPDSVKKRQEESDKQWREKMDDSPISKLSRKCAALESENARLRETIECALRISDLWLPAVVDVEHEGEAKALHTMRNNFLSVLATKALGDKE